MGTQGVLLVEQAMAGQNFQPPPLYSWCIDPTPATFSCPCPQRSRALGKWFSLKRWETIAAPPKGLTTPSSRHLTAGQAAAKTRRRSKSSLARPYPWRLSNFTRWTCPSTGPLDPDSRSAASTALRSAIIPLARAIKGARLLV